MYAGDYRCPLSCFAIACRATDGAMGFFAAASGVKYDRAVKCLTKDRADLLAFNGLPAGHCKHVRPTNPMIRTDPTVRHRTPKTKGCLSRQTALAMTHQLMLSAKRQWRKLDGQNRRPEIIEGTEFGQTASSPRSKPPDHAVTNFRA